MHPINSSSQKIAEPKEDVAADGFENFYNSFNPKMEDPTFRKQFKKNLFDFLSQVMNRRMQKMRESLKKMKESR